jgi:transcription elongation factor GreA
MIRIPMTPDGFAKMKEELRQLKTVERGKNIQDIEEARAHGDLSENAEFSAAKEKQALIAVQLIELEDKISRAEVIDPKTVRVNDRVVFGATVKLYDLSTEEEMTYQIVGDSESDIKQCKIGISSPIARGLLGRRSGDEVKIKTPKGVREFEVVSINYI